MAETTTPAVAEATEPTGATDSARRRGRAAPARGRAEAPRSPEQAPMLRTADVAAARPGEDTEVPSARGGAAASISGLALDVGARLDVQETRLQELSAQLARLTSRLDTLTSRLDTLTRQARPQAPPRDSVSTQRIAADVPWPAASGAPLVPAPDGDERPRGRAAASPLGAESVVQDQQLEAALVRVVQPLELRLDELAQLVQQRSDALHSLLAMAARRLEAVQAAIAQREAENLDDVGAQVAGLRRALQEQATALRAYADTHTALRPASAAVPQSEGDQEEAARATLHNLARYLTAGGHASGR